MESPKAQVLPFDRHYRPVSSGGTTAGPGIAAADLVSPLALGQDAGIDSEP